MKLKFDGGKNTQLVRFRVDPKTNKNEWGTGVI